MRLLVTGFGPFPGMPMNPTTALARRLGASPRLRRVLGEPVRALVLPTTYAAIARLLQPALGQADAVLMLGVATRARRIRVEARARNRASRLHPDAAGRGAATNGLDPVGPAHRRGALPAQALAILRRAGLRARLSSDAGRYLCNASYYAALASGRPALFVHVPPVPRTPRPRGRGRADDSARQTAALCTIALSLVVRARQG